MVSFIVFLICLSIAIIAGFLSALSDLRGMTIPNIYSLIVIFAFLGGYGGLWLLGYDEVFQVFSSHMMSAVMVFSVTLVMFAMKIMGAADSKMGTAYALWVGLEGLLAFLFYMALVGGVLALVSLALKKWKPLKTPVEGGWVFRVQAGENKVPYGVAIFLGALVSFTKLGYLGSEVFGHFFAS